jgi:hypothetical protein
MTKSDAFDKAIHDLQRAIEITFEANLILPALIVLYSAIDTLGWLDRPEGKDSSDRQDFMAWVSSYLLPVAPFQATAEDLYAARCATLHSHSFESDLSRRGKARRIMYSHGNAPHKVLEALATLHEATDVAIKIEHLFSAFDAAVANFRADLLADRTRAEKVFSRADEKFYASVDPPKGA